MVKTYLNVGCLVRMKPYDDLKKFGIKAPVKDIPYMDDVGVVIQILNNHVVVLWQKLEKEGQHFPYTLEKIAD
jgi:hypothetical protein